MAEETPQNQITGSAPAASQTPAPAAGGSTPSPQSHQPGAPSASEPVQQFASEAAFHAHNEAAEDQAWAAATGAPPGDDDYGSPILGVTEGKKPEPKADATTLVDTKAAPATPPVVETDLAGESDEKIELRTRVLTAKKALGRDGWAKDAIDKIPLDTLLSVGEKAAKRQTDVDAAFDDLKALKGGGTKPLAGATTADADHPPDVPGRATSQPTDDASDHSMSEVESVLTELLDDEDVARVRAVLKADQTRAQRTQAARLKEAESQVEKAQMAAFQTRFVTVHQTMLSEFPGLSDQTRLQRVVQVMAKGDPEGEISLGDHSGFVEHFRSACWAVFGPDVQRGAQQTLLAQNRKTRNSQPELPRSRAEPSTISDDDFERVAFDASNQTRGDMAETARLVAPYR